MSYMLEGHAHRGSLINSAARFECDVCDRSYGFGYSCDQCKFIIHLECAFVFNAKEIWDHPSHEGHCLKLLTTGAPDHTDPKCHLSGKKIRHLLYHCSVCELNLDVIDALCARAHLNMPWHPHPLLIVDITSRMTCNICRNGGKQGYLCPRCRLVVHESCVSQFVSQDITHPSHVRHPLKPITDGALGYSDGSCHLCGEDAGNLLYHCDICIFNLDLECAINKPPPVSLSNMKVHEHHTLTLMPRLISYVCDACGTIGDRSPYVCVECDFMIFHQLCAQLPRVIHVNHHDHRVTYKYPLGSGPGEWTCGVCWKEIIWSYGAYSCSICPRYAIHSLCATRKDVWDGKELDGIAEEVEDIEPFKRNNDDNTITHFAHEHNLLSLSKGDEESSLCGACVRPIGSSTFYKCSESDCSFILHEACADLPKKKRHFLSPEPMDLRLQSKSHLKSCGACHLPICNGFIYSNFDLLCTSIAFPFIHGSHDHHLLYLELQYGAVKTCQSCGTDEDKVVIGCKKCDYFLDFRCPTLPLTVMLPRYDDHPLTLCYGDEKASGKYWCDICERETNPEFWFYTCKDCGVTLHPGGKVRYDYELLPNNTSSRPLCKNCRSRCPGSFIVKQINLDPTFCSFYCYKSFNWDFAIEWLFTTVKVISPPWAIGANSSTAAVKMFLD
ncbi:hypothetical protein CARUB_v10019046mg [Capsella rubella]|uniref:Phorbol-ester/DAG-type domain-containing protein n=1 Tax=Capsella rubella TaxID=81985 RepID=R0HP08_9BRAS|nr:hypothetical protein CARUB_v10019046mg [Capsella rubella]